MDHDRQFWVLATLTDTVIEVDRRYLGQMRSRDREAYYEESKRLANAFGIPEALVPDYGSFRELLRASGGRTVTYRGEPRHRCHPDDPQGAVHPGGRLVALQHGHAGSHADPVAPRVGMAISTWPNSPPEPPRCRYATLWATSVAPLTNPLNGRALRPAA